MTNFTEVSHYEATVFAKQHPDFYTCPRNAKTMLDRVMRNVPRNVDPNTEPHKVFNFSNFERAYKELTKEGGLLPSPAILHQGWGHPGTELGRSPEDKRDFAIRNAQAQYQIDMSGAKYPSDFQKAEAKFKKAQKEAIAECKESAGTLQAACERFGEPVIQARKVNGKVQDVVVGHELPIEYLDRPAVVETVTPPTDEEKLARKVAGMTPTQYKEFATNNGTWPVYKPMRTPQEVG